MSNVAVAVGNGLIEEAARFKIELYLNPEGNQVLTRNLNADPAQPVKHGLMSEIANNRGSILLALRARGYKTEAAIVAELNAKRAKAIEDEALAKRAEQERAKFPAPAAPALSPEDAAALAAYTAATGGQA